MLDSFMPIARNNIFILSVGRERHLFALPKLRCVKLSTSEIIKNQIWCCLIVFLLVRAKKELNLENQNSFKYIKYDQILNVITLIILTEA
jgi:hypothetical protein